MPAWRSLVTCMPFKHRDTGSNPVAGIFILFILNKSNPGRTYARAHDHQFSQSDHQVLQSAPMVYFK